MRSSSQHRVDVLQSTRWTHTQAFDAEERCVTRLVDNTSLIGISKMSRWLSLAVPRSISLEIQTYVAGGAAHLRRRVFLPRLGRPGTSTSPAVQRATSPKGLSRGST